jgi:hypothetical protein
MGNSCYNKSLYVKNKEGPKHTNTKEEPIDQDIPISIMTECGESIIRTPNTIEVPEIIRTQETPIGTQETPMDTQEVLMDTQKTPIGTQEAPLEDNIIIKNIMDKHGLRLDYIDTNLEIIPLDYIDTNLEIIPLNLTIDSIFSKKPQTEEFMWLYSKYNIGSCNKTEWVFMPNELSLKLESIYRDNVKSYIFTNLQFNLISMTQTNIDTNNCRHIIRITNEEMLKLKEDYINYLIKNENQYALKMANGYKLYQPYIQQLLFDLNNEEKKINVILNEYYYEIDLIKNIQTNLDTGKVRTIELINIHETSNVEKSFNY